MRKLLQLSPLIPQLQTAIMSSILMGGGPDVVSRAWVWFFLVNALAGGRGGNVAGSEGGMSWLIAANSAALILLACLVIALLNPQWSP